MWEQYIFLQDGRDQLMKRQSNKKDSVALSDRLTVLANGLIETKCRRQNVLLWL